MTTDAHFRKLEAMHLKAACNTAYYQGLTIAVGHGVCDLTLPVRADYYHAAKAVHGFVYFKLLDEAAFFAANALVEDVFVLTTSFHIDLLRPVTEGLLKAQGKVVHVSKSSILAEAVLLDDQDRQIARGRGSFVRSRIALDESIGYGS